MDTMCNLKWNTGTKVSRVESAYSYVSFCSVKEFNSCLLHLLKTRLQPFHLQKEKNITWNILDKISAQLWALDVGDTSFNSLIFSSMKCAGGADWPQAFLNSPRRTSDSTCDCWRERRSSTTSFRCSCGEKKSAVAGCVLQFKINKHEFRALHYSQSWVYLVFPASLVSQTSAL